MASGMFRRRRVPKRRIPSIQSDRRAVVRTMRMGTSASTCMPLRSPSSGNGFSKLNWRKRWRCRSRKRSPTSRTGKNTTLHRPSKKADFRFSSRNFAVELNRFHKNQVEVGRSHLPQMPFLRRFSRYIADSAAADFRPIWRMLIRRGMSLALSITTRFADSWKIPN